MRYAVYHINSLRDNLYAYTKDGDVITVEDANFPDNFKLAAIVDASFLDQVFEMTNTVFQLWTKNPFVVWSRTPRGMRSTSVGDIIEDQEGNLWVVASVGFVKLERETFENPLMVCGLHTHETTRIKPKPWT